MQEGDRIDHFSPSPVILSPIKEFQFGNGDRRELKLCDNNNSEKFENDHKSQREEALPNSSSNNNNNNDDGGGGGRKITKLIDLEDENKKLKRCESRLLSIIQIKSNQIFSLPP